MNNSELYRFSAQQISESILRGEFTCCELMESVISRVKELEGSFHAWVCFDEAKAMDAALQLDSESKNEASQVKQLYGVPAGIKDIFNTIDFHTCMGSPIWKDFTPNNDARVVTNLKRQGAIVPGKTVTAEFAVHEPGPTVNPYNADHHPGTSSSGSAVAVATGMVPIAIGTQTAGSTIRPASYNGVYGFKPSFGLLPRTGVLKTLDTLDHVTSFSRSIGDLRLMLNAMRLYGENHPLIHNNIDCKEQKSVDSEWRVGFVKTPVWNNTQDYTKQNMEVFVNRLRESGINVQDVELPESFNEAHHVHETIYRKALSYYFKEEYDEHPNLVSDIMKQMIESGMKISKEEYYEGLGMQNTLTHKLEDFMGDFDILISHATAGCAPLLSEEELSDPCLMWTLCRVPAIGVPAFTAPNGMPFGLQLVSARFRDYDLLNFAQLLTNKGLIEENKIVEIGQQTATV